eukprot:2988995-Pleurochrysis_carterae.AAC.2
MHSAHEVAETARAVPLQKTFDFFAKSFVVRLQHAERTVGGGGGSVAGDGDSEGGERDVSAVLSLALLPAAAAVVATTAGPSGSA